MAKPETERKVIIEQHKKFSQSALWRLQREYFEKEGINAWVNQVPFYITSNPFIAAVYAKIVFAFMKDWREKYPEAKNHPFYIMELGTGSGRFSYYFVKTLLEMMKSLKTDIPFVYVMSDFTKHNVKYWEAHTALKPLVEAGFIDFALFDMETERPITLIRKNTRLGPDVLVNPLTVFANYIFDTVSHDAFTVHENKFYELLFSLTTDENNMDHNRPVDMEKINVDYHIHEVKSPSYYGDSSLDPILEIYKQSLKSTSFLFPIGSFHALKFLRKMANDKLLVISTDKGYSTIESLDNLGHPAISFHGSFSMMVNFHAIGEYFKNVGGESFLQTPRKGIRTSVFSSGFKMSDLTRTWHEIIEWVERFSPADYFALHSRMRDSFQEVNQLDIIASHMELAGWDPHIYLRLSSHVTSLLESSDSETIEFMAKNMPRLAENYYYMPKTECILFEIGVFFHAIKNHEQALKYYKAAHEYVGDQFGLFYNMALCEHHLGKNEDALVTFRKAAALDPESKETAEWVTFIEKALSGEGPETKAEARKAEEDKKEE